MAGFSLGAFSIKSGEKNFDFGDAKSENMAFFRFFLFDFSANPCFQPKIKGGQVGLRNLDKIGKKKTVKK